MLVPTSTTAWCISAFTLSFRIFCDNSTIFWSCDFSSRLMGSITMYSSSMPMVKRWVSMMYQFSCKILHFFQERQKRFFLNNLPTFAAMLSDTEENYLKALLRITAEHDETGGAGTNQLAGRL